MSDKVKKSIPAFVLKSIDDIAPEFDLPAKVPLRTGGTATITLQCLALGKVEWAEVRDRENAAAEERREQRIQAVVQHTLDSDAADKPRLKAADAARDDMDHQATLVMEFATSWDLSDALSKESLLRLENKSGGTLAAIINAYELAIYQGRLGN